MQMTWWPVAVQPVGESPSPILNGAYQDLATVCRVAATFQLLQIKPFWGNTACDIAFSTILERFIAISGNT